MTSNREYKWVPGYEIPLDAIERMQNRFLMPPVPMGEAWFNWQRETTLYRINRTAF